MGIKKSSGSRQVYIIVFLIAKVCLINFHIIGTS